MRGRQALIKSLCRKEPDRTGVQSGHKQKSPARKPIAEPWDSIRLLIGVRDSADRGYHWTDLPGPKLVILSWDRAFFSASSAADCKAEDTRATVPVPVPVRVGAGHVNYTTELGKPIDPGNSLIGCDTRCSPSPFSRSIYSQHHDATWTTVDRRVLQI